MSSTYLYSDNDTTYDMSVSSTGTVLSYTDITTRVPLPSIQANANKYLKVRNDGKNLEWDDVVLSGGLDLILDERTTSNPPSILFEDAGGTQYNTGINMYRDATNANNQTISFYANNTKKLDIAENRIISKEDILGVDGTVALPSYSFESDPDTGIYRKGANNIAISTGGLERFDVDATACEFSNTNAVNIRKQTINGTTLTNSIDPPIAHQFRASCYNSVLGLYVFADISTATQNKILTLNSNLSNPLSYESTATRFHGVDFNPVSGLTMIAPLNTSSSLRWSTNGTTWNTEAVPLGDACYNVRYVNGRWVICCANRIHYSTSENPWSWTSQTIASAGIINTIAWNGVNYVIGCQSGVQIRYSTNLTTWTNATVPVTGQVYKIVWNGSYFASANSNNTNYCSRSSDGITWTSASLSPATLGTTEGEFGLDWSTTHNCWCLASALTFTPSNTGQLYFSYDAITWVASTGSASSSYIDVTYTPHNDRFVAFNYNTTGNRIIAVQLNNQNIITFNDGATTLGATNYQRNLTVNGSATCTGNLSVNGDISCTGNLSVTGTIQNSLGTVSLPSYSFTGDTNTGIYSTAGDVINFATNATQRMRIDNTGVSITAPFKPSDLIQYSVSTLLTANFNTNTLGSHFIRVDSGGGNIVMTLGAVGAGSHFTIFKETANNDLQVTNVGSDTYNGSTRSAFAIISGVRGIINLYQVTATNWYGFVNTF